MLEPPFEVSEETRATGRVVRPAGELDIATAPILERRLTELICAERETVLDLSALTFMDSSGIALLIRAAQHAPATRVTE